VIGGLFPILAACRRESQAGVLIPARPVESKWLAGAERDSKGLSFKFHCFGGETRPARMNAISPKNEI
jgi:hypothetical protein